jgi:hypothetical protein
MQRHPNYLAVDFETVPTERALRAPAPDFKRLAELGKEQ